jgi:hypothetical protein
MRSLLAVRSAGAPGKQAARRSAGDQQAMNDDAVTTTNAASEPQHGKKDDDAVATTNAAKRAFACRPCGRINMKTWMMTQ